LAETDSGRASWVAPNAEVFHVSNRDMREFEEQAQKLVSQALSLCEMGVANCAESPPPRKAALCAATLLLQEALKIILALAKSA